MSTVVIDTTVWISGLVFGGMPREAIVSARLDHLIAIAEPLYVEVVEVLYREKLRRHTNPAIPHRALDEALIGASWVKLLGDVQDCRDTDDNKILDCAAQAGADFIISGDEDLLALGLWRSVRIVKPAMFVAWTRDATHK